MSQEHKQIESKKGRVHYWISRNRKANAKCIDNNVITSFCPETAADVALHLLSHLIGYDQASEVAKAMGYTI